VGRGAGYDSKRDFNASKSLEGTLLWHKGKPSRWEVFSRGVTLDEWADASVIERQSWWRGRSFDEVLSRPTLGDQLLQVYPAQKLLPRDLPQNFEPGRVRVEWFFKRMYGATRREVGRHLTTVHWGKQRLRVTTVNGVADKLKAIYRELTRLEHRLKPFFQKSAGAFVWRTIKGTSRISVHSFGAAIDLGVRHSNYWKWTLQVFGRDQRGLIPYKNRFPIEVIDIFECHGWIWGGWWYHHDTMHFEYRPELIVKLPTR